MADFATTDDLALFWPGYSDAQEDQATKLIALASSLVRSAWPTIDDRLAASTAPMDPNLPQFVVLSMVKRALSSPGGVDNASQATNQMGPYAATFSFSGPSGGLYLTAKESRMLSPGGIRPKAFAVDMTPDGAGTDGLMYWGAQPTGSSPWWGPAL